MSKKNLFVFNLQEYANRINSDTENYAIHDLEVKKGVLYGTTVEKDAVLDTFKSTQKALEDFPGTVDGIITYDDYPISTMAPAFNEQHGLKAPSKSSVLKCEHKYWSRLEQKLSIPEHVPNFHLFDPFNPESYNSIPLKFPFWIKPVKSFSSYLGFKIRNKNDLKKAIAKLQGSVSQFTDSFDEILQHMNIDVPEHICSVAGHYCLAEELVGGRQCTLEGYMFDGKYHVYGIIDSIRYPNHSSFFRYQYPSLLPKRVQQRMADIAEKFIRQVKYDNAPFNIEFFWNKQQDKIYLLEVNPRVAVAHAELFEKVDGTSHFQVPVDIALGKKPEMPYRQGSCNMAAMCFYRAFEDIFFESVPDSASIKGIEAEVPGAMLTVTAKPQQNLSSLELHLLDSYSYACAKVILGAKDQQDLLHNYRKLINALIPKFKVSEAYKLPKVL